MSHNTEPIYRAPVFPAPPAQGQRPLGYESVWTQVMEAADYTCRCVGNCGTKHSTSAAYCLNRHGRQLSLGKGKTARVRLVTVTRYTVDHPSQEPSPVPFTPEHLVAVCQTCHAGLARQRTRELKNEAAVRAKSTPTLFDL